jgi:hypothetical protein
MVYVGNELPAMLEGDPAVVQWKPITSWPTATQAQCIRLLYPALLKCDGAVILSDMDMIPMQKDFFVKDGFAKFSENQFVSLRGMYEDLKQVFMCYVGGTPKVWSELFGVRTQEDVYTIMKQWSQVFPSNGNHGGLGWSTDQLVLYTRMKEWQHVTPERLGLIPETPPNYREDRLDRGNPYEWFQWNSILEDKLQKNAYVDFHMPPYNEFKEQIDAVLEYKLEYNKK